MKQKLVATALAGSLALAGVASGAHAGSLAGPVVSEEIIIQESTSSINHHLIPPVFFVAAVAASMILAPVLPPLSDARLKTDITRVGTADNGLPLYHFRYVGQDQLWEGVMAQDVLSHTPGAVVDLGGYYGVNYDMLGLQMRAVD